MEGQSGVSYQHIRTTKSGRNVASKHGGLEPGSPRSDFRDWGPEALPGCCSGPQQAVNHERVLLDRGVGPDSYLPRGRARVARDTAA